MVNAANAHPLRWWNTYPKPWHHYHQLTSLGSDPVTLDAQQRSYNLSMQFYNDAIMQVPFEQRPDNMRALAKESTLALYATRFHTTGRNLFAISDDLLKALDHTTLGDVKPSDIKSPHRYFWVSLSNFDCGGLPGSDNRIDGAYIDMTMPGVFQFLITTRRLDGDPNSRTEWPFKPEPYFYVPCKVSPTDQRTFEQILAEAITEGEIKLSQEFAHDLPVPETATQTSKDENEYEDVIEIDGKQHKVRWRDQTRLNDMKEIENNNSAMPSVRRALSVVVNLLAFMSIPTEVEIEKTWQDDAPQELIDQTRFGRSSGARQRAEEMLVRQDFTRIKIVGMKPAPQPPRDSQPTGVELQYGHWSIGHFKTQAYGPRNSLRKIIWVKSYRVRPDLPLRPKGGGHEYLVG